MAHWSRGPAPSTTKGDRMSDYYAMGPDHEAHLTRLKTRLLADLDAKYRAGQAHHGGRVWEKPGMLEAAYEEVLDLAVYLLVLMEQRDEKRRITGRDT